MPLLGAKKPGGPPPEGDGKGALAALLVGAPSSPSPEDDHGFSAVAKAFGIPPERQATAQAALKSYIKACVSSSEAPDEDVEEAY